MKTSNNISVSSSKFVSLLLLSLSFWATPALAEAGGPFPLEYVRMQDNGCGIIKVPAGNFNADGYIVLDGTLPGGKQMFAIALMAQASGKKVIINRVSSGSCWPGQYDRVNDIYVVNY